MRRRSCRSLRGRLAAVVTALLAPGAIACARAPGSADGLAPPAPSVAGTAAPARAGPSSLGEPTEARRREFVVVTAGALAALGLTALVLLLRRPARSRPKPAVGSGSGRAASRAAKVCPRCGARYGAEQRRCPRDDTELSAVN